MKYPLPSRQLVSTATLVSISLFYSIAFAQKLETTSSDKKSAGAVLSLIEINPADLLFGRYRIAHENLILDGLSFSWIGEVQDTLASRNYEERNIATGVSLQYYPQSISLDGLFVRGESDIALSEVSEGTVGRRRAESGKAATLRIAVDIGWRVRLSERLTGSAAYGLRTTLPQTLWNSNSQLTQRWLIQKSDNPDARVQINLGVLL
jgi:hypothetical protein